MVDLEDEHARLTKALAEAESQVARLEKLLNSPFAQKAPVEVVQKEREKLAAFQETLARLQSQLDQLDS
jgi:valyl-tRNA synthetase